MNKSYFLTNLVIYMRRKILLVLALFFIGGVSANPKRVVFAGGPGTGKTSLVLALELRGEYVVHEAATDYIKVKQAYGIAKPWEDWEDFLSGIFELQRQREANVPLLTRNPSL